MLQSNGKVTHTGCRTTPRQSMMGYPLHSFTKRAQACLPTQNKCPTCTKRRIDRSDSWTFEIKNRPNRCWGSQHERDLQNQNRCWGSQHERDLQNQKQAVHHIRTKRQKNQAKTTHTMRKRCERIRHIERESKVFFCNLQPTFIRRLTV